MASSTHTWFLSVALLARLRFTSCDMLQAIDQQVDQIASAAGKALGSLWTGIGGAISSTAQAASSVAGQLEQAAMHATGTNGRRSAPWYYILLNLVL